ncbi:bifunctional nicotinamide-nucleotide adenylyltransferase/Nudix hydroxylase [Chitinimonas sp.]|uniref:bifunctional nicotinamide-nucleotide adenylyltransferase/Nudix hydroxylase n=1 Tax=Chitinimonas sp. TaxID=1934313 RepID=UPI0035B2DB8D
MQFDTLVYIGRFQPFHLGHAAMLELALAQAQQVVLVLGSAHSARTTRNPFSVDERQQMIIDALPAEAAARLRFVPMRDYYNGARWAAAVRRAVAALPGLGRVGLFGHFKDASSGYLRDFPDWPLLAVENQGGINAADLRAPWFASGGDTEALAQALPASVRQFLANFASTAHFARLQAEYAFLQQYRQDWQAAPYPPVFVTVDAVVCCQGHVLLVQRGGQPGVGCWALPGGFLDQRERVADASLRELMEETCLAVDRDTLMRGYQGQQLFDHPDRSARGRTLTHAFHYQLDCTSLPAIRAADDAQAAKWLPISDLQALEALMHDDHFIILDHFLHLLAD